MKLFLCIFLAIASSTSALLGNGWRGASEGIIQDFTKGMEESIPLHVFLGVEDSDEFRRIERSLKEELENHIREAFDRTLKKIEDAVKNGKKVNEKALEKLRELKEKMKELNIEESEVEKTTINALKKSVDILLRQILERMGIFDKRSVNEPMQSIVEDLDLRNILIKLRDYIQNKMDINAVKNALAKIISQGTDHLCRWLTNKGKTKVLDFFDDLLEKEDEKKRSVSDIYQKVKDYFDGLDIELKEKFLKFGEWAKQVIENGLEKSRNKIENVKNIAKKFLENTKKVNKDVAVQALEFFREYKKELGELYDHVYEKVIKYILDNYAD